MSIPLPFHCAPTFNWSWCSNPRQRLNACVALADMYTILAEHGNPGKILSVVFSHHQTWMCYVYLAAAVLNSTQRFRRHWPKIEHHPWFDLCSAYVRFRKSYNWTLTIFFKAFLRNIFKNPWWFFYQRFLFLYLGICFFFGALVGSWGLADMALSREVMRWPLRPKQHQLEHLVWDFGFYENPTHFSCHLDEDLIGILKKITMHTHPSTMSVRTLEHYSVAMAALWVGRLLEWKWDFSLRFFTTGVSAWLSFGDFGAHSINHVQWDFLMFFQKQLFQHVFRFLVDSGPKNMQTTINGIIIPNTVCVCMHIFSI